MIRNNVVRYNKGDKFLDSLIKEINSSSILKNIKNPRVLHVYGVIESRKYDVMLPGVFPYFNPLSKIFQAKGLKVGNGSYWELSETYNNKVLGLGHAIRKNNQEACKKVIMCCAMALNNLIDAEDSDTANSLHHD